jgi:hypothetical protein
MSDTELAAYLGTQAEFADIAWDCRVFYRAAWHEITRVRGAVGVPRL